MRALTLCILAVAACCAPTRGNRPTLPIIPYTPFGSTPGGRSSADGGQLTYGGLQRVSHTAAMVGYGTPSSLLDLRTDCAANEMLIWNGAAWVCAAAPGDIGTGTAPDLAAWTGPNTLGNYAGTGSVADKAISALSATGAATFSYFVDSGATGVTVSNNVASIDPTYTQRRVTGTCSDPFGIITIAQDGTVTCSTTTVGSSVGTANTFPIYTAARTLGNSPLIYDGSALISTLKNVQVGGSSAATLNLIDLAAAGVPANMPSGAAAMNIVQPGGAGLLISRPSASASSPRLSFYKTRSTDNTRVAVANGDPLGDIHFEGASDGTTDVQTAEIKASVTGTVASGSIPTGLFFYTGTTSAVQALSLNSDQTSTFGGQMDLGSHKIVNVTNGASAQDAAAFGQISSAVNAAVSGTSGAMARFTGPNAIGNASSTDDGAATIRTAKASSQSHYTVGDDTGVTTAAQSGYSILAYSDGSVYIDSKTIAGGLTKYRLGDGAQTGATTTYETVTNSSGAITWAAAQTLSSTAHIVGAATLDSSASIGTTLTQTAGNVTLNTSSGTTAITGHGTTAGDLQVADTTTGLAAGNYLNTTLSFSGTVHEGTGAGTAPCTNGFKCIKTLSVSNTGDVVTVSEGNAISWIAIYADSNNAHDTSIALYTDHGDVKLNQISGSLLAHGAATFDNGITSTAVTNTLGDLTINNTIAVTSTATLSGATTVKNDFFVATTGGTNKLKVLAATGHVNVLGTAITTGDLSACGTTPAVATGSTDVAGRITEGTTATGCTLTFKNTYTNVPFCVCTGETSGVAAVLVGCHATATTLVLENASASSDTYQYFCVGQSGGT